MISEALQYISAHSWLNGLLQFSLLVIILWTLFHFIMGENGGWIRNRIPLLSHWYGHLQIRNLLKEREYGRAGEKLLSLGQMDQAAKIFEAGQLFGRAADIYYKKKRPEKAAQLYERAGDPIKAAEIYIDLSMVSQAETLLSRAKKKE